MITFDNKVGGIEHFRVMVDHFGKERACDHLQIHRTTLERILRGATKLPHAYLVALWWETEWGRSVVDSHNVTLQRLLYAQLESKDKIIQQLELSIQEFIYQAEFSSANAPVYKVNR